MVLRPVPKYEEQQQDRAGDEQARDAEETPVAASHVERRDIGKGAPVVTLTFDQPEDDGEQGAAGEQHTNRIEVLLPAEADAGKQPDPEDEGDDPDRNVDPEDGLPAEVGDEEPAQRRARDRSDAGDRAPDAKRRAALVGRKDVGQNAERLGREDGATHALDHAGRDQLGRTLRQATGDRRQREDGEADEEEPFGAEHVAEPAGGDQQHRVGEDVGVEHPEDLVESRVQAVDDARNRDVHDREIEQDHEEAKAEHEQDDPWVPFRLNRRLHR